MDPITAISLGATAAGAATSAVGGLLGGQAQASTFAYQAGVARINQQIAKQNADYERAMGEVSAQQSGMKTRYQMGQIKSNQGASGLDLNSGSAVRVRQSQQEVGAEDQAIIRASAARRAFAYETEGFSQGAQATLDTVAGKNAQTSGAISGISSLLSGAGSVSAKWLQGNQVGIFGGGGDISYTSPDFPRA